MIIPIEIWQQLINSLNNNNSGLAWIDDQESKAQILTDLQESLREAAAGETFPLERLWDNIEA